MTATDAQVRIIMREREKGRTQEQAAANANLQSRKTAAKYERLGKLPSELNQPRRYRTRLNPFEENWPTVKTMLEDAPSLEAKAVFEWLCEQHPGRYQEGQLRTFQRHVATWRALNQKQVAILEQVHRPGEVLQTDGTWLTELGVTIQGQPFKHILIHSVLPYSNWEWGRIAQSESLAALQLGLQSTLAKLGHTPKYHRTDNSSAATYWPGAKARTDHKREYTDGYLQLLDHYGLEPQTTNLDSPHENGDVESSNGGTKRAIEQYLLLHGSRDFESVEAYEDFLCDVMNRRNRSRRERLAEELAAMKPLAATLLAAHSQVHLRVTQGSLIRVQKNVYSVPTSLIGCQVTVRIHEWRLDVYYQTHLVATLPRLIGEKQHHVNYRHVIDSLIRKPGGFRDYRYRDDLFPSLVFRRAWERLNQWQSPRKADITYLRILRLAARGMESEVAAVLERLLATPERWDETDVERTLQPEPVHIPQLVCGRVHLQQYDRLLAEASHGA
jgi:hypothetical protein